MKCYMFWVGLKSNSELYYTSSNNLAGSWEISFIEEKYKEWYCQCFGRGILQNGLMVSTFMPTLLSYWWKFPTYSDMIGVILGTS